MNESPVEGACDRQSSNESRVGGACGPPPPFAAPLVPRCALSSGATPRDVLAAAYGSAGPTTLAGYPVSSRSHASSAGHVSESTHSRKTLWRASDGRSHVHHGGSTSRGVAPVVSAQRGTSGATNGGGGPQAPPTRLSFEDCRSQAPPTQLSFLPSATVNSSESVAESKPLPSLSAARTRYTQRRAVGCHCSRCDSRVGYFAYPCSPCDLRVAPPDYPARIVA
jgi:hypothetical protein